MAAFQRGITLAEAAEPRAMPGAGPAAEHAEGAEGDVRDELDVRPVRDVRDENGSAG
jgi:hypothetical protein